MSLVNYKKKSSLVQYRKRDRKNSWRNFTPSEYYMLDLNRVKCWNKCFFILIISHWKQFKCGNLLYYHKIVKNYSYMVHSSMKIIPVQFLGTESVFLDRSWSNSTKVESPLVVQIVRRQFLIDLVQKHKRRFYTWN